jgi:hypothetical protein
LERQLTVARQDLAGVTSNLDSSGVPAEARGKHPRWRSLHARRLRLERRLRAADALTALSEDLKRRKAEKAAAALAPEPEPAKAAKSGKQKPGKDKPAKEKPAREQASKEAGQEKSGKKRSKEPAAE